MPVLSGLDTALALRRWLRQLDWVSRHEAWARLKTGERRWKLINQVKKIMTPDELIDGCNGPMDWPSYIKLPTRDKTRARQLTLHHFFKKKPKVPKRSHQGQQRKITEFFHQV